MSKHQKMMNRLSRGILGLGEKNSGEPGTSKINPNCKWYKNRLKRNGQ